MSYFKTKPVRSKKLRDSARGRDCSIRLPGCNGGGDTTVLCHMPNSGRGIARKASDVMSFFGCSECHARVDGRVSCEISPELFHKALIMAHAETIQIWIDEGLVTVKGAA